MYKMPIDDIHDIRHDFCSLCGEEIESFEDFQLTSDREGRVYAIHADTEMCKQIMEVKNDG